MGLVIGLVFTGVLAAATLALFGTVILGAVTAALALPLAFPMTITGVLLALGGYMAWTRLRRKKDDLEEDLPFFVDLVNLNNADVSFLGRIRNDWVFLGGKHRDWAELQRKAQS